MAVVCYFHLLQNNIYIYTIFKALKKPQAYHKSITECTVSSTTSTLFHTCIMKYASCDYMKNKYEVLRIGPFKTAAVDWWIFFWQTAKLIFNKWLLFWLNLLRGLLSCYILWTSLWNQRLVILRLLFHLCDVMKWEMRCLAWDLYLIYFCYSHILYICLSFWT